MADVPRPHRPRVALPVIYILVSLLGLWLVQRYAPNPLATAIHEIPYSEFRAKAKAGAVSDLRIGAREITGQLGTGDEASHFFTVPPPAGDARLIDDLDTARVAYTAVPSPGPLDGLILSWLVPMGVLAILWFSVVRRIAGGAGPFGASRRAASVVTPADVGVTFADVGGADEAIDELREIIQFLKTPERFARLGGRIPKGVLLVGPPGTGKTLIAKATAGEAQVPFFEASGSEFIEMFVGVGAARVRDLFEQARVAAPAIVFIDEIDAIGTSRAAGGIRMFGNDERDQTLNQLLAEIDGFKADRKRPVIIMAATNRPEILDPALLRAGRFDRQVALGNPDLVGRRQILKIHTRAVTLAADFDLEAAARLTPGFSGADLANVINEAALLAARRGAPAVELHDFEAAMERVLAGLEHRTRVMNDRERRAVACHECGHALVAQLVPHGDPVSKISIVPRSRGALGYTLQMPTEDRYLLTQPELEDRLAVMLGGRAAETITFGTLSTGATDDLQRATELARRMVTEFGMSDKLGSVRYAGRQLQYLPDAASDTSHLSPQAQDTIDGEVLRVITAQYERAQQLLIAHREALASLTEQLLTTETLDGAVVRQALAPGVTLVAASRAGP